MNGVLPFSAIKIYPSFSLQIARMFGEENDFNKVMDDNDSILESVKNQDHHALGIIDRFARTLKTILTKLFLEEGTTNWINELKQ